IEVSASPIERFDLGTPVGGAYGKLVFLGGLQLSSNAPEFGGLSGLRLSPDGKNFTAISDRGTWLHGVLSYDGARLTGLSGVTSASTPGRDGRPLPNRPGADTEALEIQGRTAWVTSERVTWLTRYALGPDGRPEGKGVAVALPPLARKAPRNEGFEAMAATGSGAIVLIGEKFLDENGDDRAWVVGGKAPFAFSVRRTDDFSPTDLARLPDGDFVMLERRYVPPISLSVRMKRLAAKDIVAGAVVDGPVLMQATLAQTIDNFEGLSAHRAADGRTVLTVVSDDNFSILQRTLLMQFALPD
ncbi:MAG: esterase-like activity of phytase family protein, partial [Hansschlegelia sp.]